MNNSFGNTNSPSKGPTNSNAGNNRTKFPFIIMPVSNVDTRRNDDCDLVLPSLHIESPLPKQEVVTKAARRNAIVQKELRSRFNGSQGESYVSQEDRRRLYASTSLSQTNLTEDVYLPSGSPGATLLFNGIHLPAEQFHGFIQPRVPNRTRNSTNFRRSTKYVDVNENPLVSASTSTPQLKCKRDGSRDSEKEEESALLRIEVDRMGVELREKESQILSLKSDLMTLKETLEKSTYESHANKTHCTTLRHELARVENQIEALEERFESQDEIQSLKDYLIGQAALMSNNQNSITVNQSVPSAKTGSYASRAPDYDRLIQMIRELNSIAGNYQSVEMCYTLGGATFKQPEAIVLSLYRNGIVLDDGEEFRSFASPATTQFIQDIYDGYFPTELQAKHPDGITLLVKDRRYIVHPGDSAFVGKGQKLNESLEFLPKFYPGMKFIAKIQPPLPHVTSSTESTNSSSSTTSNEWNYRILPELFPSQKPQSSLLTHRTLYKNTLNKPLILKLKNLKTEIVYKLKTSVSSTPEDILLHLETHADAEDENGKYELINCLPLGVFSVGGATLRDYGITRNTLIYFRPI